MIIIGDTNTDIQAAINVGCYCIAFKTKIPEYINRDALDKANKVIEPHEIPMELIKVIKELI